MVSILVGLPAIIAEIEQRVLACVPSAFATDTWVKADRKQYEAQNDILIDYWRHFDLEITDSDPSNFQGNYAYQNRDIRLDLYTWYSRAGANRVAGTPDVDWQALMMQDAHDLQRALQGPIVTSDGSTGRLIYDNANRSEDDQEATLIVSFRLPVFLRGTAQVPELYLGPNQAYTLNAGTKFYLVAQSDLACSASLSSSPAGCTHATALDLGSGTPQVIEVTSGPAGTYTFTLASSSGTTSCTVVVYPASDFVLVGPDHAVPNDQWTLNLAVAAANNGTFPVTGSANLTLPENVTIVNNKGVIPVTIKLRGSHSVTVGDDTCNFTSATPAATIPRFDPFHFFSIYGNKGRYAYYLPSSGCITPAVEQYCMLNKLGDNTRRFTLAARMRAIYTATNINSSVAVMGVGPTNSYSIAHMMLHTVGASSLSFYYYNVGGVLQSAPTNTALVNDSNWYDYVFNVYYDCNTMTGYIESWRNGVYTSKTNLTSAQEPGYNQATWFHKFLLCPNNQKMDLYDIYVSNTTLWTQTEVDAYHGETTVDPSKYTLHWTCEKNTDLPYHVEYDSKNNMPLTFNPQTEYLTWVPKQ